MKGLDAEQVEDFHARFRQGIDDWAASARFGRIVSLQADFLNGGTGIVEAERNIDRGLQGADDFGEKRGVLVSARADGDIEILSARLDLARGEFLEAREVLGLQ